MSVRKARRNTGARDDSAPRRLERFEGRRRSVQLASDDPARTLEIGRAIGRLLPAGSVLSLEGSLGAGKTLIAKGICAGLGVSDEVLSPSFVLAEEYSGAFPVVHFDLYRLDNVDEIERIGLFDAIDGRAVVIVEWGDRLGADMLGADVRIVMEFAGERSRKITIDGGGNLLDSLERSAA
ncbi:MAG: tRNA (adenosine(37)-N6)-threonylcarbamoyltransferase complex ATPase subunit type 1 TsaE [Candidatus Krumholzibacteria bacterium]|nr:tRNA (adenosine(37)-N6)-threonylcarbamoyltransferase complex ATPase subunit type 1 TsaE [Candidatus Krumholzibacteria bacterium]